MTKYIFIYRALATVVVGYGSHDVWVRGTTKLVQRKIKN